MLLKKSEGGNRSFFHKNVGFAQNPKERIPNPGWTRVSIHWSRIRAVIGPVIVTHPTSYDSQETLKLNRDCTMGSWEL